MPTPIQDQFTDILDDDKRFALRHPDRISSKNNRIYRERQHGKLPINVMWVGE